MGYLNDVCFGVVTFVVIATGITMALCFSFIIPLYISEPDVYYRATNKKLAFGEAVEICSCLAKVFPDGTKDPIKFKDQTYNRFRNYFRGSRSVLGPQLENFKFLAALSIPAFSDDDQGGYLFACNGVIVSKDQIITSKSCVKAETEWFDLIIRTGSPIWSAFGEVFGVNNFSKISDNFVLLTANSTFNSKYINNNTFMSESDLKYVLTIGWDDLMYLKNLEFRSKFQQYQIFNWSAEECWPFVDTRKLIKKGTEVLVSSSGSVAFGMEINKSPYCKEFKTFGQPETSLYYYM